MADEDTSHVFWCSNAECMAHCHKLTNNLCCWLSTNKTHPSISCCILTTLHGHGLIPFDHQAWSTCHLAAREQDQIGFFGFLVGQLLDKWESLQDSYGQQQGHQTPAQKWSKGLCFQLLQISHGMWLFCNQQILAYQQASWSQSLATLIQHEFSLGSQDLLPCDWFYVSAKASAVGFTIQYIFSLPLPGQQLWLQAVQNAWARGSQTTAREIAQMWDSLSHWLQHDS